MEGLEQLGTYLVLDILPSIRWFVPEIILFAGFTLAIFADLTTDKPGATRSAWVALGSLVAALAATIAGMGAALPEGLGGLSLFRGAVVFDPLANFFKVLFLVATILVVILILRSRDFGLRKMGELHALLLVVAAGLCLMASSTHLLLLYLSLEMVSYVSYVLVGYVKEDRRASEAGLKYVLFGSVSSGAMIFGLSILYGLTGEMNLTKIGAALAVSPGTEPAVLVASFLVMAGIGYKIAAVPFHFWCPDVYEGAPTPLTAFLSVAPKAAGFAMLARVTIHLFGQAGSLLAIDWPLVMAVFSALTMTLGNVIAVQQSNVKRLLAYSSIAHAGYLLMGLACVDRATGTLSERGLFGVLFYLVVYLFMNLGAFAVVIALREKVSDEEEIDSYRGIGPRAPLLGVAMAIFLFSLTGLPPLAGFVGKFFLFAAVIEAELYWLAVVGILNSVISLYYYARILKAMYLERVDETGEAPPLRLAPSHSVLLVVLAAPTVLLGIFWAPLAGLVQRSVGFLF
ncbi:MAG: NADH-quinone oxidoreductase subunit NuoN [Candidatus Eisenbacteria bacterium]|nr:NADH-quinone oxidoreductase subunit NuoN [Candidatus Latescibacterota bacterium]MBD3302227.1 NADH-quinone oxidoreductase subunit NuoN [Candidatus Eisenbacteria bacterium]